MRFVILHYHIFKNAGSTVEEILRHSFGDRLGNLETPTDGGLIPSRELVEYLDTHPALRAFSSHQIRYPMPQAPGYLFFDICFLRDPLDRLRSFYDYFRQKPNPSDPMSTLANRCSLGDFASGMIEDHLLFIRNNQVNLLACGGDSDEPDDRDLNLAIRRMRATSFLGVVDVFEQSAAAGAEALRSAFPELDCARPAVNVSRGMEGTVASRTAALQEACRPDVYEELLRITALDRKLVDLARVEVLRRTSGTQWGRHSACRDIPASAPHRLAGPIPYWRVLIGSFYLRKYPLFDRRFYLDRNPDVRRAGLDPLIHYIRHGAAEDRKPHPLFDPIYYRATSGQSPENPLMHFLSRGAEATSPHPLFDCPAYLEAHPDVAAQGLNPLVHYLTCAPAVSDGLPRDIELDIGDVRLTAGLRRDADGVAHWTAEPQQMPFLRGVNIDQISSR